VAWRGPARSVFQGPLARATHPRAMWGAPARATDCSAAGRADGQARTGDYPSDDPACRMQRFVARRRQCRAEPRRRVLRCAEYRHRADQPLGGDGPGFESIPERKPRRRQLTGDGKVQISGRSGRPTAGRSVSNRPRLCENHLGHSAVAPGVALPAPHQQPFLSPVAAGSPLRAGRRNSRSYWRVRLGASSAVLSPRGQSSRGSHRTFINYITWISGAIFMFNDGPGQHGCGQIRSRGCF
jgi:hypothetical protein